MKLLLLLLFTTASFADDYVQQVQVRVISFDKAGAATSLEAAQPNCDESLYASLVADTAAGKAVRAQDQTMVVRGGQRSKVEALRQFPYPTEFTADPAEWFLYPSSFVWQNLGYTMEAEVTVGELKDGWPQRSLDINLAPQSSALLALHPWPVPDFRGSGQMGRTLQPVLAIHKLSTQALAWTGHTLLLSVTPVPDAVFSDSVEPAFRYTFLRAGLYGEKPAPSGGTPPFVVHQRRLHAVTIRLPREEAAAFLLQQAGDDASLYGKLCGMVANGRATVSDHTAILCRGGQRSTTASRAQFHYPEHADNFIPRSWAVLDPGSRLEALAEGEWDSKDLSAGWNVALIRQEAPELVPYHPSAKHPALHGAAVAYIERRVISRMRIPSSGVLCAATTSTAPATDDTAAPDGLTEITFLLQSPPPGTPVDEPESQTFLQAAILSLPDGEGTALKKGDSAAPLIARFLAGEFTCPAHAAVVIRSGQRGKVECVRYVPHPGDLLSSSVNEAVRLPGSWEDMPCGLTLECECVSEATAITTNGFVEWDTAPVLPFGKPGAAIPDMDTRRCRQKLEFRELTLKPGQPVIADVRASNAREGTPEHGRWHVLVLLAR